MEYGIGLITLGDETKVMGAPPHVSKTLQKWVIIIPGEGTKDTAAHKIATHLNVPVDAVLRVLPPGGISIREVNP